MKADTVLAAILALRDRWHKRMRAHKEDINALEEFIVDLLEDVVADLDALLPDLRAALAPPTPDRILEGHNDVVSRIVWDIAGAFSLDSRRPPCFSRLVNVEEVVRFVLLRAELRNAAVDGALAVAPPRCKGCEKGLPVMMLDDDGVLTHLSKRPGVPSHAVEDAWWPCAKWRAVAPPRPQEDDTK